MSEGGIIGDKVTEVRGDVVVQATWGLAEHNKDLGMYSECGKRQL